MVGALGTVSGAAIVLGSGGTAPAAVAGLAALGVHDVTVVAERRDPAWPTTEMQDGFNIRRIWCVYRRGLHIWTASASLAAYLILHGRKYDVWHLQQYDIHAVLASSLSRLLKRPIVVRTTNTGEFGIAATLNALPAPSIAKRLISGANAFIALTEEMRSEIEEFGIAPDKVSVISNGVSLEHFFEHSDVQRSALRSKLRLPDKKIILFSGRLSVQKAPNELLLAWARLRRELGASWQLVLVGDGPLGAELHKQADVLGITDSIVFAGLQTDMYLWMGAADIFVQCSRTEGMSNALLEAMATGLPVVTTPVSGSKALVSASNAGIVISASVGTDLAAAIRKLALDADLRASMGRAARATVVDGYSIEAVARRHEQLYSSLTRRES